jgi:hypothetical protein
MVANRYSKLRNTQASVTTTTRLNEFVPSRPIEPIDEP